MAQNMSFVSHWNNNKQEEVKPRTLNSFVQSDDHSIAVCVVCSSPSSPFQRSWRVLILLLASWQYSRCKSFHWFLLCCFCMKYNLLEFTTIYYKHTTIFCFPIDRCVLCNLIFSHVHSLFLYSHMVLLLVIIINRLIIILVYDSPQRLHFTPSRTRSRI